jgi:hypothetical protein
MERKRIPSGPTKPKVIWFELAPGATEGLAQNPAFRLIGSEPAFQDSPKRGDEPRGKNALERRSWRQLGVYS